ncbi:MAG: carotenoid 1,2-hydratase [Gammaproteobacteria bacterium]|nr:carotenoid 1,2-hydratase [Gammaproteobacteria bacterium]
MRATIFASVSLCLLTLFAVADESAQSSRLSELLTDNTEAGFKRANAAREFLFPRDHGPHEGFRNEWWYITGNLDDDAGRRFGFELTIFRFSLTPGRPQAQSDWRTNQVYIAHLAVTDVEDERFYVAERFSRGALGLAGAQTEPFRVWIDNWEIASNGEGESWRIVAADTDIAVDLALTALKKPVLNGDAGLSRKSSNIDSASYYYSITRFQTAGTVSIAGRNYRVSGLSWLDREWSTSALAADQVGWDWFALQLSSGTDVMLYNLRKSDATVDANSSGTLTFADGRSTHLRVEDFNIRVNDTWDSPAGGTYPSSWRIHIPEQGLQLDVQPVLPNQELFTTVRYWEGAVDVSGEKNGVPIAGRGYVELTGYAD